MEVGQRLVRGGKPAWLGPRQIKPEIRQGHIFLCVALWSFIAFLVVHHFLITTVVVQGTSMRPTLKPGDCRFVNCWLPHFRAYKRGDIVVIRDPARDELMVKRIIGLPRDQVQVRDGGVYLNGQRLPEPYLDSGTRTYSPQFHDRVITLAPDSYFVMGDNRAASEDSRYFGGVNGRDLVGLISR